MKIRTKMLLGGFLIALLPVIVGSFFLANISVSEGKKSLENDAKQSLIAARDITASQITNYIEQIEKQALTLSESLMVIEAMENFSRTFAIFSSHSSNPSLEEQKANLQQYYTEQFGKQFSSVNKSSNINPRDLLTNLDKQSINLQYEFISNNPNPLGEKQQLTTLPNDNFYNQNHKKYHPVFRNFIERFGYYDLFLVDHKTGDIVYSVFKELDYATSLIDGPYASSGIGQAFNKANKATTSDFIGLTDFAPYVPSYNAPASFIASPIFDGKTKVGILILQMPVDKINAVMTHNQQWIETGLGRTGETYLVGQDYKMRSNGRFLLENKANFLSLMSDMDIPPETIQAMDDKSTSIGLQSVETKGTKRALSGETGFDIFPDYRGINVLSAYKPIKFGDRQWAIMSEIDEAEAFEPVQKLQTKINFISYIIIAAIAIIAPLIAWFFAKTILDPLKQIIFAVSSLSDGKGDLTQRLKVTAHNEIGDLSHQINKFIDHLDHTFSDVIKSAIRLVPMSEELAGGNVAIAEATEKQNTQISYVKQKLEIAQASSVQVNTEAKEILHLSNQGATAVREGILIFGKSYQEIKNLQDIIASASESINSLKEESDRIGTVIEVINSISDQTNLLALNAAIEAARAGEAGRGFAVVADEVRALSYRTSESTLEVSNMVNAIQSRTEQVVETMSMGITSAQSCNEQVESAKHNLESIDESMSAINQSVNRVSFSIVEQDQNFNHVTQDFEILDEYFENSKSASEISVQIGVDMSKMSVKIHSMVEKFTLTDNSWSTGRRNKTRAEDKK